MHQGFELDAIDRHQQALRINERIMSAGASDHLGPAGPQNMIEAFTENVFGCMAQHALHVRTDLQDRQVWLFQSKQQTVRLNGSGKLNRLIRTIGQEDFKSVLVELAHSSTS